MKTIVSVVLISFTLTSFSQVIDIELFAIGLNKPVNIKHAGDDRLFVVEQDGTIKIITLEGDVLPNPFLDINDRVITVTGIGDERGFLGLAFHPDYVNNGYFYVNYINNSGNTVISRFTRQSENLADTNSELILLTYPQPFPNHNGGDMAFGPDGYLYISSGDGGSAGDPDNNSQTLTNLLGKILRLDVDNPSNGNNYGIPNTNPFLGNPSGEDEIWAYGLRNPWKFSFDNSTNEIWIADVGQSEIEEINVVDINTAAPNFGWRCFEGNQPFINNNCPPENLLTFPIASYTHSGGDFFRCSITGGYRYRGASQPSLQGIYFFADFCSEEIGYLQQDGNDWVMNFTAPLNHNWVAFGEGQDGELYISSIGEGSLYKIIDSNLSAEEFEINNIIAAPNPASHQIIFTSNNEVVLINKLTVYDLLGKTVSNIENVASSNISLNLNNYDTGMYLAKIEVNNSQIKILKFIVN